MTPRTVIGWGSFVVLLLAAAVGIAPGPLAAGGTSTFVVPASVDSTGSSDVTSDLVAFFEGVPDGSTVQFPPKSTYRIEGSIILSGRHDLTIDGTGATFVVTTDGTEAEEGADHSWWGRNWPRKRGQFILKGGSGYTIRNLTIAGPNDKAGPTNDAYVPALEAQHGIEFYGTTGSVVDGCEIHHTYGDPISVSGASDNITITGCHLHHSGRQGLTVDEATNVKITGNTITHTGRSAIDLEPARPDWVVEHITIAHNTIGRANGVFLAAHGNGPVNHITIHDNILTGEEMKVLVKDAKGVQRHHWTITNNTTDKIEGSPLAPLRFSNVDHIVMRGNHQPVASTQARQAVSISGATTVSITDNHFPIHDTTIVPRRPPTGEQAIITINGVTRTQPIADPPSESESTSDEITSGDTQEEIGSDELVPEPPPSDQPPSGKNAGNGFIETAYRDFLGRSPTRMELDQWRARAETASGRRQLVQSIGYSDAWLGAIVDGFYLDTLERPADATGRSHWIKQIRSRQMTPAKAAAEFYASSEYFGRAGGGSITGWIGRLYQDLLGRSADATGRAHWSQAARAHGRSVVAAAFYDSPETLGERVDDLYLELLGRAPEPGGRNHWARTISASGNDVDLAVELAASREYYLRASR